MKIFIILLIVTIQIASALLLDYSATYESLFYIVPLTLIFIVLFVNFFRFLLYGWLHKRFDLSKTYPLITIFFPIIYGISLLKGEAALEITKFIGIIFIIAGIIILQKKRAY
jgi:uncharacterized membrane protein